LHLRVKKIDFLEKNLKAWQKGAFWSYSLHNTKHSMTDIFSIKAWLRISKPEFIFTDLVYQIQQESYTIKHNAGDSCCNNS